MLEAFSVAACSQGPLQLTELEAALKGRTVPQNQGEGETQVAPGAATEEPTPADAGQSLSLPDASELVGQHMDRCFTKSMMILSEFSASSVELFLRIGESYLTEQQKAIKATPQQSGEEQAQEDSLPIRSHVELIRVLRSYLANEVAMISASFVESLQRQAQLVPPQETPTDEGKGAAIETKLSEHVQEIYTSYVAKCHSHLHDASMQFVGICQLLLLKHVAKA